MRGGSGEGRPEVRMWARARWSLPLWAVMGMVGVGCPDEIVLDDVTPSPEETPPAEGTPTPASSSPTPESPTPAEHPTATPEDPEDTPSETDTPGEMPTPGDGTPTPGDGTPTPGDGTPTPGDGTPTPEPTLEPTPEPTPPPSSADCRVTWDASDDWGNGFVGRVRVHNNSGEAWSGWEVAWTFPGKQRLTDSWDLEAEQTGAEVAGTNMPYNGEVADGGYVDFGFVATYEGVNEPPESFSINETQCEIDAIGDSDPPDPTPTPDPEPTPTPEPDPEATPTPTATPDPDPEPTPTPGPKACSILYDDSDDWNTAFNAHVTVTNRTGAVLNGWSVAWSFAGNQKITLTWNTKVQQVQKAVSAGNEEYNGRIQNGEAFYFGFQATYSGTNTAPSSFTLNGIPCEVTLK